ncbi:unnamed protein product [Rotaria sp. Silwood2]|nr:unnamed protein product [Rotaria sp. Silwood2]
MKRSQDGMMSFNNFLSRSLDRHGSLELFARPASYQNPDSVGILFVISINPEECEKSGIPYADVSEIGVFQGNESEILFTTDAIFCINSVRPIADHYTDRLWKVELNLTENDDNQLKALIAHEQKENQNTGWARLSSLFLELRQPEIAEQLYKTLLQQTSADRKQAYYIHQLGSVYYFKNENSKAMSNFKRSLEIFEKIPPPNHHYLATAYMHVGNVHNQMREFSKALALYQQAFEIQKISLPPNHPHVATSLMNMGSMYCDLGDYHQALSLYQQALEIQKTALPLNHSNFVE